jgi:predicted ATPase
MKIIRIKISDHPGIGNLDLSFSDKNGAAQVVVLAGGNGCGKTVILESIHSAFAETADNIGTIEIELEPSKSEIDRLNVMQSAGGDSPAPGADMKSILVTVRSSNPPVQIGATITKMEIKWIDTINSVHEFGVMPNQYAGADHWARLMTTYLSEANVSFNAPDVHVINNRNIDFQNMASRRIDSQIANEITQLLVDVRAADNNDLRNWTSENPGLAPPSTEIDRRFSKFTRAIDYMFPTKRFNVSAPSNEKITPRFVEHGRVSGINQLSTGEKQIVFRAGFFLRDFSDLGSSVVLIDEPELSLHPEWQARIVGFYKHLLTNADGSCPQIIIATHSPFIVHGAGASKVVILEKDNSTGVITQMPEPSYPSVAVTEAVRAFNIDAFLSDATNNQLLVLTEGETDKIILETAWTKLRPNQPRPFEARSALGAKNINITLNDDQVIQKVNGRKVVGLFDFDEAYNHWNGLWKKSGSIVSDEVGGLIRKHPTASNIWGMLLPVPPFRNDFASQEIKGNSILSIEFMFSDGNHIDGLIRTKPLAAGQSQPEVVNSKKAEFAEHVNSLDASEFSAFEPLFARFTEMLNGTI